MATEKFVISRTDGWVLIAADGVDYVAENAGGAAVELCQSVVAPAADAPYHVLGSRIGFVRVGGGAAYVRAGSTVQDSTVIVTS